MLTELALLFALCVGAGVLFVRLRLPPIVGFLAIGALIGPHAIGLVRHEATVQQLAEVIVRRRSWPQAEQRLVPPETAGHVTNADDGPGASHETSPVFATP